MELRLIDPQQVIELLPMSECIEVVDGAMRSASNGEAVMPLRDKMALPGGGLLGWMPGYMASPDVFGVKLVGVFPENFALGMHSHHGVVVLFETRHGRPFAVVDASEITAIRTAAASAMATRLLAREDASALAIMGYGAQGRQHLESMLCVRDFTDIRVPILLGDWLEPGQHINAVGTSFPGIRELDTEAVVRSRLYVDLRAGAIAQAGEFQMARDEGAIDESHILGEIGEVALGRVAGRESPSDITLYKSLGLVVQDLASAYHVYENATGRSVGVTAQF
jgi:ornithine cyclodeaminase